MLIFNLSLVTFLEYSVWTSEKGVKTLSSGLVLFNSMLFYMVSLISDRRQLCKDIALMSFRILQHHMKDTFEHSPQLVLCSIPKND